MLRRFIGALYRSGEEASFSGQGDQHEQRHGEGTLRVQERRDN